MHMQLNVKSRKLSTSINDIELGKNTHYLSKFFLKFGYFGGGEKLRGGFLEKKRLEWLTQAFAVNADISAWGALFYFRKEIFTKGWFFEKKRKGLGS